MKVVERDIYIPFTSLERNWICNWPWLKMWEIIIEKKEWLRAPCCSQRTVGKTKPPAEQKQKLSCAFLQHTCQRNTQPSSCKALSDLNSVSWWMKCSSWPSAQEDCAAVSAVFAQKLRLRLTHPCSGCLNPPCEGVGDECVLWVADLFRTLEEGQSVCHRRTNYLSLPRTWERFYTCYLFLSNAGDCARVEPSVPRWEVCGLLKEARVILTMLDECT